MQNLYLQGISVEDLKSLIRKEVEEVLCKYVEFEGKRTSLDKCQEDKSSNTLLSRKETAALLSISLPTLSDWTNKGVLKSYRIGGKVFYRDDEVKNALTEIKPKYKKE
ncbi:MAG: helix-turn-helix domain-containing protein [Dysgonomonas sp.]|nr:helix-turn-helix domain-containing protein [Dysgonomonas sp.]